jgi:hypothetical protein
MTFYHANNRERLREICKRERMPKHQSRDFHLARQIPFPAILDFAGFPRLRNQQCFSHKGDTGTSLSFYPRDKDGRWIFHCNNPECGDHGRSKRILSRPILNPTLAQSRGASSRTQRSFRSEKMMSRMTVPPMCVGEDPDLVRTSNSWS